MNFFKGLIDRIAFIIQMIIIGLILAMLRHNYRWIYYPVKWFVTTLLAGMIMIMLFVAFKLIFGVSEKWFSQLMYDVGNYTNMERAFTYFLIWLATFGAAFSWFIDEAVKLIEINLICGDRQVRDSKGRWSTQTEQPWNPTTGQIILWNTYGLFVYVFVAYKLLTHQGTSLFGVWE